MVGEVAVQLGVYPGGGMQPWHSEVPLKQFVIGHQRRDVRGCSGRSG